MFLLCIFLLIQSITSALSMWKLTSILFLDQVALGKVRVLHVPSQHQFADIFTKGLPTALFREFVSILNVRPAPVSTEGGC